MKRRLDEVLDDRTRDAARAFAEALRLREEARAQATERRASAECAAAGRVAALRQSAKATWALRQDVVRSSRARVDVVREHAAGAAAVAVGRSREAARSRKALVDTLVRARVIRRIMGAE